MKTIKTMKRGYFAEEKDGDFGFPIVATSAREAKKIAATISELDCEFIDIRVRWIRDAKVDDLPVGYFDNEIEGLRRGMFDYLENDICDECGKDDYVEFHNGKILCRDCRDAKML